MRTKTTRKEFRSMKLETIEKLKLIKELEKLKTSSDTIEFLVNEYTSKNKNKILEKK